MNDPTEKKYEIEIKLEKEINNVNLLKERASKSSNLTKGMVNILSSFEHRLARLEETILPVYNQTGNLQKRQENIERTLKALDHVIGFYGVSQEVEPVIRADPGLNANGDSGLETFLKAMDKLQAAMEYFQTRNSGSVELDNVIPYFSTTKDIDQSYLDGKFSKVPFTKNPEEYIKYTPAQVSAMIDQFFDVAA